VEEKQPLVSIIVRTKDRPKLLKNAIKSIAEQTYKRIEVVLVNDGGCDLNAEELKNMLSDMPLNYIKLEKNMGRAHAGNMGIENAKGEYIGFLDDDDIYYPDHVETLFTFLETEQNYKVAYTDSVYVFQEWIADRYVTVGKEVPYSQDFERQKLLIANYIPLLNVMCSKDLADKAGLFDEKLEAHEDWDLWIRLSQYTDFHHIKKITAEVSMRTDGSTLTSANRVAFLKTARIIHKRYSSFVADEKIFESQNTVEWSLSKEVVNRGEKLENSYVVDIAEALIQQKDSHIRNLETAMREKDAHVVNLETAMREKDAHVVNLETAMRAHVVNLETAMREKDATLNNIYSSRGWKALLVYYKVRGKIFPPNIKYWRYWPKRLADASIGRFTRFLVSIYSSSALIRRGFVAVNNISHSYVRPLFPTLHDKFFVDFKFFLKKRCLVGRRGSDDAMQLYSLPEASQEEFYPKVSVIVPNYNHARYLRQRLETVYRQTYKNIEVILLDDGSTDESTLILEEYRLRYPEITRCCFNDMNSGSVFYQWKRGIESARGELIWIAESDDYCSENLLEELVNTFTNEAVMLAFCRTVFVDGEGARQIWSQEEYLSDLIEPTFWRQPFIKSAHFLVNNIWGIKNTIPNVSSAVFRNPGKLELLEDEHWKKMRICGDWIFYLHLIRGGLVAYTPNSTNFFRMHKKNTSVNTYKQDIYYREHEKVVEEVVKLYCVQEGIFEKQRSVLELHWRLHREDYSESDFKKCYDYERVKHLSKSRKPNLLMVPYALSSGGGETFPIRLSNLLKSAGYSVTLLNCHQEPTQPGIRKMLHQDIPLLELDGLDKLNAVVDDMGIEIVHSHHAWVDVTICLLLKNYLNCKVVVTTHGMYEMMSHAELNRVVPLLNNRVNKFIYTADKNFSAFDRSIINKNRFIKIYSAIERVPITPVPREEIGINKEDFVLCIVSRAIPEKGWEEGIEAITLARKISGKDIHLLLIGDGPEYGRLRRKVRDYFIHFLGFRANVRDYFATADLGFLPSRFHGESAPFTLIECLHANRPMLASDIGEIAKMLETDSGLAGSVFTLDNWELPVKRIAEFIAEYATNRGLYSEHLKRVPEAAEKFDPEKMLQSYEMVYQEVIGDNGE